MENSKEYELYLDAIDGNATAWYRRNAVKRLSNCRNEEALYYLKEIIVDRYCLLPDWLKKVAKENYVSLCLEFL
jgi:transcription-repair coupling factor (superfamily II helicase)